LVGDPTYGGPSRYELTRPFLHSARLAFKLPATGEESVFEAPFPADLTEALRQARAGALP